MSAQVPRALRLECVTVGWNLVEDALALIAAGAATSVALLGWWWADPIAAVALT